jgi:hypothetical protein
VSKRPLQSLASHGQGEPTSLLFVGKKEEKEEEEQARR